MIWTRAYKTAKDIFYTRYNPLIPSEGKPDSEKVEETGSVVETEMVLETDVDAESFFEAEELEELEELGKQKEQARSKKHNKVNEYETAGTEAAGIKMDADSVTPGVSPDSDENEDLLDPVEDLLGYYVGYLRYKNRKRK